ncbi:MAG: hypothetical protein NUV98_06120 [Candidatus Roizmanbacteria bacterium]|nr:hypothetical protein [Candidatus Roizmanbacteria bacterium]
MITEAPRDLTTEDIISYIGSLFPERDEKKYWEFRLEDDGVLMVLDKQSWSEGLSGLVRERILFLRGPHTSISVHEKQNGDEEVSRILYKSDAEPIRGNKLKGEIHPFDYSDLVKLVGFNGK